MIERLVVAAFTSVRPGENLAAWFRDDQAPSSSNAHSWPGANGPMQVRSSMYWTARKVNGPTR
jgi:hypothetical protein